MSVTHHPLALAALCLAVGLGVSETALAQNQIGSPNVVINLQALDRLGPAPAASPYVMYPQGNTGIQANTPAPLLGDSGTAVKLRPPRPTKAAASSAGAPAAAALPVAKSDTVAAAPAAPRAKRAERPTASAAPQPAVSATSLPPPAAPAAPPALSPGRPLSLPSAQPSTAPASGAPAGSAAAGSAPVVTAAAPPPPAVAPAPPPQPAALPPPPPVAAPAPGDLVMVFDTGKADLPSASEPQLKDLVKQLAGNEARVQIRAYASASGADAASGARRLSLSRALAVRTYLIDQGVRSTRIDVRALGAPTDGSVADRVEVAVIGR